MAAHWSSDCILAEYRDLQANAMAVDCTGQLALLAGRRCLAIVNLDMLNNPLENLKKITRQSKWDIAVAQWNPHSSHGHYFVTASNQRADVSSWSESTHVQQASLRAHTRVISDLDWSPADPNVLATCSVDTFTYLWDIREPRKYTTSLQAVAGASQVKWNKINQNLLCTTHDGDIRIWDPRKSTTPVQYIAAHLSKIHGLDWSPSSEYHLATSSQDCSVKFWDVNNPRQAESKLPGSSPVWRARYTPFGRGLVTVVVPQLRRGENSLFLWNLQDTRQAVHTFVGHTDVVLEFQWRKPDKECLDYQLVTWSKDQSLRLWKIDTQLQKYCGQEFEDSEAMIIPSPGTMNESLPQTSAPVSIPPTALNGRTGDPDLDSRMSTPPRHPGSSRRVDVHSPQQPKTLHQEMSLVNFNISNVELLEMEPQKRVCRVSAVSGKNTVELIMYFPETYPNNAPPNFHFGKGTNLQKADQAKIIKHLQDTSVQQVKFNRSCIEPCLIQLVSSLESLSSEDSSSSSGSTFTLTSHSTAIQRPEYHPIFGHLKDQSVPFPRTSGARFCGMGFLVCFTRRTEVAVYRRVSSASDMTPRAMSVLSAYSRPSARTTPIPPPFSLFMTSNLGRSPPSDSTVSLTNYYNYKDCKERGERGSFARPRPRVKTKVKDTSEAKNKEKDSSTSPKKQAKTGPVIIYDTACLLAIHKQLAESYVLDTTDIPAMCRTNAKVAATIGRKDLVQMWSLAALASSEILKPDTDPDKGSPWAAHPFGRKMLKSLIDHYLSVFDVQTLAMLCCAFGSKFDPQKATTNQSASSSSSTGSVGRSSSEYQVQNSAYNAYHTVHPTDTSLRGWNFIGTLSSENDDDDDDGHDAVSKMRRSNSWSEISENSRFLESPPDPGVREKEQHSKNMRLLDTSRTSQYDQFKKSYADSLYRWGLLNQRAEILKYVSTAPQPHKGLEFTSRCQHCGVESRSAQCYSCRRGVLQCVICHVSVRGASSFCLSCGHGGHSNHMQEWFRSHEVCPSGCGCLCLQDNPMQEESGSES